MNSAVEMGRVSAKGSFNLFLGTTISLAASSVGLIVVARLLSPSEYGLVAIAWIVPSFASLFRDWGVSAAATKYIAQYSSENKPALVKATVVDSILFLAITGLLLSCFVFVTAGFLAETLFRRPELEPLLRIASLSVIAGGLGIGSQSIFIGFERMELSSATMISQSVIGALLAPLLVYIGYGALGAVSGLTLATLASSAIGLFLVYREFLSASEPSPLDSCRKGATLGKMVGYGVPISVSNTLTGFSGQLFTLLLAVYVTDTLIGNYQIALNMLMVIGFFAGPINTVLLPAFSKLDIKRSRQDVDRVFQFSVKVTALIAVPAAVVTMVMSQPAIHILFGSEYEHAPLYLSALALGQAISAIGIISIGNLLKGIGRTREFLGIILTTVLLGVPLAVFLIPRYGVMGLIFSSIMSMIPYLALGPWYLHKYLRVSMDWYSSGRIIAASSIAGATAYLCVLLFPGTPFLQLVTGTALFISVYVVLVPFVRAIDRSDVSALSEIFKGFGRASFLTRPVLRVFAVVLGFRNKLAEVD